MNSFAICLCVLALGASAQPAHKYQLPTSYAGSSNGRVQGSATFGSPVFAQQSGFASGSGFGAGVGGASGFGAQSFQGASGQGAGIGSGFVGSVGSGVGGGFGVGGGSGAGAGVGFFGAGSGAGAGAGVGAGAGFGAGVGAGAGAGAGFGAGAGAAGQVETIVSKDFYIHSAPEEAEENLYSTQNAGESIRQNYRVVFIKAPSQKFTVNTATLGGSHNEEKTVIYVLAKRPDLNVVQQQLAENTQKLHKPEVHFIKYETAEEAQLAQQQIQAQYDALGGSTSVSNEGLAPVHSVIGSAGGAGGAGSAFGAGSAGSVGVGNGAGVSAGVGGAQGASFGSGSNSGSVILSGSGSGFGSNVGSGFTSGLGSGSVVVSGSGSGSDSGFGSTYNTLSSGSLK